jgi:hypothetical protein|tara:strand:- start:219 stop:590 length:372 start_codon:yes stop_codon:yes gene_type:complete
MVLSELEMLMLVLIGWQASTMYRHWKDDQTIKLIIKQVDAEEERIDEKIIEEVKARLPICYVEKHGTKDYLLYNRDTEEFVCQGSSYEELAELCKDRFDTVLVKAKDKSMWFTDGKVKELTSE